MEKKRTGKKCGVRTTQHRGRPPCCHAVCLSVSPSTDFSLSPLKEHTHNSNIKEEGEKKKLGEEDLC